MKTLYTKEQLRSVDRTESKSTRAERAADKALDKAGLRFHPLVARHVKKVDKSAVRVTDQDDFPF